MKKILSYLLVLGLIMSSVCCGANAAAKKKKVTVRNYEYVRNLLKFDINHNRYNISKENLKKLNKSAKDLSTGANTIKVKPLKYMWGYFKFTAKKAGTYQITVNNLKTMDKKAASCYLEVLKYNKKTKSLDASNVGKYYLKLKGEKYELLSICNKDYYNLIRKSQYKKGKYYYDVFKDYFKRGLSKSGTIKLKKGETIYLEFASKYLTHMDVWGAVFDGDPLTDGPDEYEPKEKNWFTTDVTIKKIK